MFYSECLKIKNGIKYVSKNFRRGFALIKNGF